MKKTSARTHRFKIAAAAVGACAAGAMGIVGVLAGDWGMSHQSADMVAGPMTMGQTVTEVYSATMQTSVAAPTLKAVPYGGSGS